MPNIEIAKNKNASKIKDKNKYINVLYKFFLLLIIIYRDKVKYQLLNCQNNL